jgi:hypothetical protein
MFENITKKQLDTYLYCFIFGYVISLILVFTTRLVALGCVNCGVLKISIFTLILALGVDVPVSFAVYYGYKFVSAK